VLFELAPPQTRPVGVNMHTSRMISNYSFRDTILIFSLLLDEELSYREIYRYSARHIVTLIEKQFNIGLGPDILEFVLCLDTDKTMLWKSRDGYLPLDYDNDENVLMRRESFEQHTEDIERRVDISREAYRSGQLKTNYNRVFMDRLEDLLRISDEKDIQIVFLLGPWLGERYTPLLPLYNRLPTENRVSVADPDEYEQLRSVEMSFDGGHLNVAGATEYTEILSDKLDTVLMVPTESLSE